MYQFLWIFFIYAFLGWCLEVAYVALISGRFVNRGFLNGPVCPIYGFGVLLVIACLAPLQDHALLLFAGSVVLASALEWGTGFILEKLFRHRWWDYSNEPFNLNGYICLRFSLGWGLACLLVVEVIHPAVTIFIARLPQGLGRVLLFGAGVGMAVDLLATVKGVLRMTEHLRRIDEMAGKIRESSDELGQSIARRVIDLSEKGDELKSAVDEVRVEVREKRTRMQADLDQLRGLGADIRDEWKQHRSRETERLREGLEDLLSRGDRTERRLLRAFPHIRSVRYREAMERLRERLREKE